MCRRPLFPLSGAASHRNLCAQHSGVPPMCPNSVSLFYHVSQTYHKLSIPSRTYDASVFRRPPLFSLSYTPCPNLPCSSSLHLFFSHTSFLPLWILETGLPCTLKDFIFVTYLKGLELMTVPLFQLPKG